MKNLLPLAYLSLLILGIPWYWSADDTRHIVGIPLWVCASLLACFLASCLTAAILLIGHARSEAEKGASE
ncbi:MAG: hypothetical protein AAF512_00280 [Pseudomonadota bacterium]